MIDVHINEVVSAFATGRKGLATRAELIALGLDPHRVDQRVRTGFLQPVFPGVYVVGHRDLVPGALQLAATLAIPRPAFLARRSALHLRGLLREAPPDVEVLVPGAPLPGPRGVDVRRTQELRPDETLTFDGIPMTCVARAIADCAADLAADELENLVRRAYAARYVTREEIAAYARRKRPGMPKLRRVLQLDDDLAETLSKAERVFVDLLRRSDLPFPKVNRRRGRSVPDFEWPGLIAEIDGFANHGNEVARRQDVHRDGEHLLQGSATLRLIAQDVVAEPIRAITRVAKVYGATRRA